MTSFPIAITVKLKDLSLKRKLIENFSLHYFPLYYFTYLEDNGLLYKFGLIDESAFKADMLTWNIMALSGRLHKPIRLIYNTNIEMESLIGFNRETAV